MSAWPGTLHAVQIRTLMILSLCSCANAAWGDYTPPVTYVRGITTYTVNADGSYQQDIETVLRIDTAQAIRSYGQQRISFNSTLEELEVIEAFTVQPDGNRIDVLADAIRTTDDSDASSAPTFSDSKVKVIVFPKVEVGSELHYRFRSNQHTAYFPGHFFESEFYSPHFKYLHETINLVHSPDIRITTDAVGVRGGKVPPLDGDKAGWIRYQFDFEQNKVYPPEDVEADLSDFAPHFFASSFQSYAELGKAYHSRALPKAAVTPPIKRMAEKLTEGVTNERDKIRRIYEWVAGNIRYVGIYVGAGGYVPHDAQSVLNNRYGDCKDHAVLLESLLRAVGIESTAALINSGTAFTLPKLPVVSTFNHVITYVPSQMLFLDSTSRFTPLGLLPEGDEDKQAVLAKTGEVLLTTPSSPARDYQITKVKMQIQSDGTVQGSSEIEVSGYFETQSRASRFAVANREQKVVVDKILGKFNETGKGEIFFPLPLELSTPWYVRTKFELDPIASFDGPGAIKIPNGMAPGSIRSMSNYKPIQERHFPHVCNANRYEENIELTFPSGVKVRSIPNDVSFNSEAVSYVSTYRMDGQRLMVSRRLTESRTNMICGPEDDLAWADFAPLLRKEFNSSILFN